MIERGGKKQTQQTICPPLMILAAATLGTRGMEERLAIGERAATEEKAVWREEEEVEDSMLDIVILGLGKGGMMSTMTHDDDGELSGYIDRQ